MSALFISLEEHQPRIDEAVNGKPLSHFSDELEALANRLGVTSLMTFYSVDPEDAWSWGAEETEEPPTGFPWQEEWFAACDGLVTVRSLLRYLEDNPTEAAFLDGVRDDLLDFQRVLTDAEKEGVRWHLSVDA